MTEKPVFQTGYFTKCELNVLVDMFLEGHQEEYIAEVLNRAVSDVQKQIRFKGLQPIKNSMRREQQLKEIVKKHCGVAA